MDVLVVDGYNIINQWRKTAEIAKNSLEDARQKFLEYLSNYQGYKQIRVIAVFDAHYTADGEKKEMYDNVEIVYTKEGQTADSYIERLIRELNGNIVVATSDFLEQTLILGGGAIRMSARELIIEIEDKSKDLERLKRNQVVKKNYIENNLSPKIMEKLKNIHED